MPICEYERRHRSTPRKQRGEYRSERIERVAEVVAAESAESDRIGGLTPSVLEALRSSRLLDEKSNYEWTGYRVKNLGKLAAGARRTSRACPATSCVMLHLFDGHRLARTIDPTADLSGFVVSPVRRGGRAERLASGAFRLDGHWPTVVGAANAGHVVLPFGSPDGNIYALVPIERCEMSKRPDPSLPGAFGARSIRVDGVIVSRSKTMVTADGRDRSDPKSGVLAVMGASIALGAAERAVDDLRAEVARRSSSLVRVPAGDGLAGTFVRENEFVVGGFGRHFSEEAAHARLGNAIDALSGAVLRWNDAIDMAVDAVESDSFSSKIELAVRLGAVSAFGTSRQILIDVLDGLPGNGTSLASLHRSRRVLDFVGRMQVLGRADVLAEAGRFAVESVA